MYSLSEVPANQLRYNGVTKAEAVTGGVDVTGDLTVSNDLTVTGTITGTITSSGAMNAGSNSITTTGTLNAEQLVSAQTDGLLDKTVQTKSCLQRDRPFQTDIRWCANCRG